MYPVGTPITEVQYIPATNEKLKLPSSHRLVDVTFCHTP
ncbi:hypothetical protein RCH22_002623 [Cryobacterium psychrotolerans]|nr:hypothetical protein [Cryobacterium psychrotolerans]